MKIVKYISQDNVNLDILRKRNRMTNLAGKDFPGIQVIIWSEWADFCPESIFWERSTTLPLFPLTLPSSLKALFLEGKSSGIINEKCIYDLY